MTNPSSDDVALSPELLERMRIIVRAAMRPKAPKNSTEEKRKSTVPPAIMTLTEQEAIALILKALAIHDAGRPVPTAVTLKQAAMGRKL